MFRGRGEGAGEIWGKGGGGVVGGGGGGCGRDRSRPRQSTKKNNQEKEKRARTLKQTSTKNSKIDNKYNTNSVIAKCQYSCTRNVLWCQELSRDKHGYGCGFPRIIEQEQLYLGSVIRWVAD